MPTTPIRGIAAFDGDEILGFVGYSDWGEILEVFSSIGLAAKCYPVTMYKLANIVLDWVDEKGKPAFAYQSIEHDTSAALLTRLGFYRDGDIWRY